MEEEIIQKFKDLILDEHYCEDCNELCGIGEAFPLEFVAKYIIKLEKENKLLKKVNDIVEKIDTEELVLKIEDDIENLIEELTKVRPSMLNDEALKLFNTIMAILDERDKLIKENTDLKEITNKYDAFANDYIPNDVKMIIADREYFNNGIFKENFIPKSKIKEKIEELEKDGVYQGNGYYCTGAKLVLQELIDD